MPIKVTNVYLFNDQGDAVYFSNMDFPKTRPPWHWERDKVPAIEGQVYPSAEELDCALESVDFRRGDGHLPWMGSETTSHRLFSVADKYNIGFIYLAKER